MMDSYLGRGPFSQAIEVTASVFFDHGEETYPVLQIPSNGPKGAAVRAATVTEHLAIEPAEAAFVINISVARDVSIPTWESVVTHQLSPELFGGIQSLLRQLKGVLDTVVGSYALYQYPLVWRPLYERHSYAFTETETGATTKAFRHWQPDNFIPFKLNAAAQVSDKRFIDPIHALVPALLDARLTEPLIFLKDSLWEDDLRARFLLQFWIIEFSAERRASTMPPDAASRRFVQALEEVTTKFLPEHWNSSRSGRVTCSVARSPERFRHAARLCVFSTTMRCSRRRRGSVTISRTELLTAATNSLRRSTTFGSCVA